MDSKNNLQTLVNALDVLEAFTPERHELGVSDLARLFNLPKAVVHRILATFENRNYLVKNPQTRKYSLSSKWWGLGCVAINQRDLGAISRCALEDLVQKTGETSYLSLLEGLDVVYTHKVEGKEPLRVYVEVGGRAPAYCTATGKVHLAHAPPGVIDRLFATRPVALTKRTIVEPDAWLQEFESIRREGVAVNRGERRDDIGAVAAPVFDHEGRCVAALGVSGPRTRFSRARLPDLIRSIKDAASDISRRMGYRSNQQKRGKDQ